MTGEQVMEKALNLLRHREPRMGSLLAGLEISPDPEIKTACTDGIGIRYNPKFAGEVGMDDTFLVLCHEIAHIGLGHPSRMAPMDHEDANLAADHVVNNLMLDLQMGPPRNTGWVCDRKYQGWTLEQVYRDLHKPKPPKKPDPSQKPGKGQGPPDPGGLGDITPPPPGATGQPGKQVAAQIAQTVAGNVLKGLVKSRGLTSAGSLQDLPVKQPYRIGYESWLEQFMSRLAHNRLSFSPTHQQYAGTEIVMPRVAGIKMGKLVLARDSSGSVPDLAYRDMIAQTLGVVEQFDPDLVVVDCDCQVKAVSLSDRGDPPLVQRAGRGGTRFEPVFSWVSEQQIEPEALIYMTDAEGSYPKEIPNYPTAWVCYGPSCRKEPYRPTFGEIFEVEA